jgi:glycosyltransferase involved in cell wall biosynthesis
MRITIVLGPFFPVPPVLGGAVEKVHSLLAKAYQSAGHEVTIISRQYDNFRNKELVDGISYIRIPSFNKGSSIITNLALDFYYALRVSRSLPQSDITITNSFFSPLLLSPKTAGKIYVHVARFPKHQMLLYSRADRLQAISRSVAAEIVHQAPSLARKVVTIGYPVSDSYFISNLAPTKNKIVLFVGRIAREKGIHLLLKSFTSTLMNFNKARTFDWKLRIVGPYDVAQGGDGVDYFQELQKLAEPLGPACEFVGPIFDEKRLVEEYQAASVFVYPSVAETGEALGLAPMEAMAAGCAVIVSNLRCFDDYVEDEVNALRFEHKCDNPETVLTAKLTRLLGDQSLMARMADKGNNTARKFHTSEIARKMLSDFQNLLSS